MLVAALRAAAGASAAGTSHQAQMLGSLKRYALTHLGDPDLSPGSVAQALYISPRQVHRLFAREQTTFGAWLRRAKAAPEPQRPRRRGLQDLPVAQIAAKWGFRSNAHFTRSFSARFGIGPRDFRRGIRGIR